MSDPLFLANPVAFKTINYVIVASVTILGFDYCMLLDREIELVWKTKFTPVTAIYMLARYSAFLDVPLMARNHLSHSTELSAIFTAGAWLTIIGIAMSELILVMRTYVLWNNSKRVLYMLLCLWTALTVASLAIEQISLQSSNANNYTVFAEFLMLLSFETVVMCMTLYQGYKRFRHSTNPFIEILFRDGVVFFICIFLSSAANIAVLVAAPTEYEELLLVFQRVIHVIFSTRILLHVRELGQAQSQPPSVVFSSTSALDHGNRRAGSSSVGRPSSASRLSPASITQ